MNDLRVAYDARGTITSEAFDAIMASYRSSSDASVARLDGYRAISFDDASDERLDVWGVASGERRPVVLAIHGGYWKMLSRFDTAFMASPLAAQGIATVTVDYSLAPAAPLEEMIRQVRACVAWIHHHGTDHGLDPERIVVLGSSAGAHLAAMTIVGGWQHDWQLPEAAVAGALLLSGLFDLRPLIQTPVNEWLALDADRAVALSPTFAPTTPTPAVIAAAACEASGFAGQSVDFHRRWAAGAPTSLRIVPDRNHFDVFLDLADADSDLFADLMRLIQETGD